MAKNAFLAKQEAIKQKCFEVGQDTASQQFFDYMCIVMHQFLVMEENDNRLRGGFYLLFFCF